MNSPQNGWKSLLRIIFSLLLIAFCIVFTMFAVPIFIDWMYKTPAPISLFAVNWGVEDALQFYGQFASAAATILAVYLTFRHERKNRWNQMRDDVIPLLSSENFSASTTEIIQPHSELAYIGWNSDSIPYVSNFPPFEYKKAMNSYKEYDKLMNEDRNVELSNEQKERKLTRIKELFGIWQQYVNNHFILEYRVFNCGAGNANRLKLYVNDQPLTYFTLLKDEGKSFVILFDSVLLCDNEFLFCARYEYEDIYSSYRYEQCEKLRLFNDGNGLTISQRLDWILADSKRRRELLIR